MSCSKFRNRGRRGFVLPTAGVMFMLAIPITGLVIDVGNMYLIQSKLQAAVDAGSLAGARALARGTSSGDQVVSAASTAVRYVNANFPAGYMASTNLVVPTPVVDFSAPNYRTVEVSATVQAPHLFLRWFGGTLSTINASALASRRDVNIVIVMDRSGSLANSGSCAPLKAAAQNFVTKFAEGRDNVGLITFATSSRVDFALANNFSTANPNVSSTIGNVTCTGATSSAQGLWQGYQELTRLNQPTALNVILFFTDGEPTAVTTSLPIKSTSGCSNKQNKVGVYTVGFSSGTPTAIGGIMDHRAPPQPMSSDLILINTNSVSGTSYPNNAPSGCSFANSWASYWTSAGNDVAGVPTTDIWGNNLVSGYQSVTTSGGLIPANSSSTNALNLVRASTNAADNAAARMRSQAAPGNGYAPVPVVIFSIGLGGSGAASDDFLRRVANDVGSSSYNNSAPTGLYVYAANSGELASAFNRVASEVLRLAE